jgi:hypothetical protein
MRGKGTMLQITRLSEAGITAEGFQVEEHLRDGKIGWTVFAENLDALQDAIEHCYGIPHVPRIDAQFGCPFCAELQRQESERVTAQE